MIKITPETHIQWKSLNYLVGYTTKTVFHKLLILCIFLIEKNLPVKMSK